MTGSGGMQIDLEVSPTSMRKWKKAFNGLSKSKLNKVIAENTRDVAKLMEAEAKKLVPVDTGRLRASIQARRLGTVRAGITYSLVATAPYASDVEYGTGRQRSQPYMRPAYRMYQGQLSKRLGRSIKQQWSNSVR